MILMIDNYDSFTYNLVQYLGQLGQEVVVHRNDEISIDEIRELKPHAIFLSPGPCTPKESGITVDVIKEFYRTIPIMGVCLGHQAIGLAWGGRIVSAPRLMHGKTSWIHHDGRGLFRGLPEPFEATRYHSLIVHEPVPDCLKVTAFTSEGEVMAIKHKTAPAVGLQFHPESILTEHGKHILKNFLGGKL